MDRCMTNKKRLIVISLLATGMACWRTAPARAQRQAMINRASDQTASVRLGQVGGAYTGRYGNPASVTNVSRPNLGIGNNGIERPNFFGAGWQMGNLQEAALPQAFLYSAQSVRMPATASPWAKFLRGPRTYELAAYSGATRSQSLSKRLSASMPRGLPVATSRNYIREPQTSSHAAFFGLNAVPAYKTQAEESQGLTWVALMENENDAFFQQRRRRALSLFKEAMTRETEDRAQRLSEAQLALREIRDMDSDSSLPCLLLMHVALEKDQVELAVNQLQEAVNRNPSVFMTPSDLGSYCGSPEILIERARQYVKIGDDNPTPEFYALQGYFAWVLEDEIRLEAALNRMMDTEGDTVTSPRTNAVRLALSAAAR